jgi:hypothetical protein
LRFIRFDGRPSDTEEGCSMSAAVIDLQDFRKKREADQSQMSRPTPTRPWMPVWVWVVVWPV